MDFPLNYIMLSGEARTASSEQELNSSNAEKTCGIGMRISERVCECGYGPNEYYSVKLDTCLPKPTSFDGEHDLITYFNFHHGGMYWARYILLDLDECTEIEFYRTTNYRRCVPNCMGNIEGYELDP